MATPMTCEHDGEHCELCNDERLGEDRNEDGLCEPCAEAKEKQGYLIGE